MVAYLRTLIIILLSLSLLACAKDKGQLQGYVEGDLVYLSSPNAGQLLTLPVERGQSVQVGQLIFQLDPQPQLAELQQAQAQLQQAQAILTDDEKGARPTILAQSSAQLQQAQAQLRYTEEHYQRMLQLFHYRAINQDQLNLAKSNYQQAQQTVNQYNALIADQQLGKRQDLMVAQQKAVAAAMDVVKSAQWQLQEKTLQAPATGVIEDTFYKEGEQVAPNSPVASLLTPHNIHIIFFVSERRLANLHLGDKVVVTLDGSKTSYAATINYIAPQAEYTPPLIYSESNNQQLVFRIRAKPEINQALQLHPGQPVYVTLR